MEELLRFDNIDFKVIIKHLGNCKYIANITTNAADKKLESEDFFQLSANIFAELKTLGKIIKIETNKSVYLEDQFHKIVFDDIDPIAKIVFIDNSTEEINLNEVELDTVCFLENDYEVEFNKLRTQIVKLQKLIENAA